MNTLALIGLLGIAFAGSGGQGAAVSITVRETADVAGTSFTLGEIADIAGSDKELVKQLSSIVVGTSPLPGLSRPLGVSDILIKLRFNHFDPRRFEVHSPASIHVTRASSEIPVADVVKAAVDRLTEERKGLGDNAVLEPAQLPIRWYVGSGKREYQASVVRGSIETGPVTMQVIVLVNGAAAKTVEVPIRIRRMVTVLMAKRPLMAHTVLTADDVTSGPVELTPGSGQPLTDPALVIGKRATRQIPQGGVLTDSCVEVAPVIAAGAPLTLEIAIGGVRIRTGGIARAPGAVGQTIRVYATETHKEFSATVIDPTTARVEE